MKFSLKSRITVSSIGFVILLMTVLCAGQVQASDGSVLICRGVPPWAPHTIDQHKEDGTPTEGRPYRLGHYSSDDVKQFRKDGLTFEFLTDWTLEDDSNSDAQQFTLWHRDSRAEIRVFVHRRRIEPEKLPKVHKSFVEPYVTSTAKQFIAIGAKPERSTDKTNIGTTSAEGVTLKAVLGGEPGAAKIYWALIGQRAVVLTFFGPDKELGRFVEAWDRVRTTLQVESKK